MCVSTHMVSVPTSNQGLATHSREYTISGLVAALKRCGERRDKERGKGLHLDAVEASLHTNKYVANALINMYSKCGSMGRARAMFDSFLDRNVVSWNTLILGYVENGESLLAMDFLRKMDCEPTSFTYVAALKACTSVATSGGDKQFVLENGMAIHRQAKERRFDTCLFVGTNMVDMYSKCGCIQDARGVFDNMLERNVVSWTSLIMGYVENGEMLVATELFMSMDCEPNAVTFVAVLQACTPDEDRQFYIEKGMATHRGTRERGYDTDIYVASSLVEMYSKCGCIQDARCVFDHMLHKNVVSWTSLIMGYVENSENQVAMDMFKSMDCEPNSVTFIAALKACECIEALHAQICRLDLEQGRVATTLVDVYGKCGDMYGAECVFNRVHTRNTVLYNALLTGYASLGDIYQVFSLIKSMHESGLQMDTTTYTLVLTVCNHTGMVDEGKRYFDTMSKYSVCATVEHYNCMVDMLGRANRLHEALTMVNCMPFEGDHITWTSLLGACRKFGNMEVGKVVFEKLVEKDDAAYVLMNDIYKEVT